MQVLVPEIDNARLEVNMLDEDVIAIVNSALHPRADRFVVILRKEDASEMVSAGTLREVKRSKVGAKKLMKPPVLLLALLRAVSRAFANTA